MKVLILGGGAREHALAWRLSRDPDVGEVICAPGNPGISALSRCEAVDLADPDAVLALAAREQVDLTVVGPEAPLERGLADLFRQHQRPIVGPGARGAALECSKAFSKAFMAARGVPTARFTVANTPEEARAAISSGQWGFPLVVKADGLAAGKGVIIAADAIEAEAAVRALMIDRQFGAAGARLVLEECLSGPEVSFFVLCDGALAVPLGSAQDHKRIWDNDRGPNTGGMGAFAPSPLMTGALTDDVMQRVVQPVLEGMASEGQPYRGFLYVSLMLTTDGPKVIEFNVRLGDPETQVLLPLIEGPFAAALLASATGSLAGLTLRPAGRRYVGVVLASRGYPGRAESGQTIDGLDRAERQPDVLVFHAGTRTVDGHLATAGGRVLTVVGGGATFEAAMTTAYGAVDLIRFDGMQYRHDIGRKAVTLGSPA